MYQGSDIAEPVVSQQPAQLDLRQPERRLIARRLLAEVGRGLNVKRGPGRLELPGRVQLIRPAAEPHLTRQIVPERQVGDESEHIGRPELFQAEGHIQVKVGLGRVHIAEPAGQLQPGMVCAEAEPVQLDCGPRAAVLVTRGGFDAQGRQALGQGVQAQLTDVEVESGGQDIEPRVKPHVVQPVGTVALASGQLPVLYRQVFQTNAEAGRTLGRSLSGLRDGFEQIEPARVVLADSHHRLGKREGRDLQPAVEQRQEPIPRGQSRNVQQGPAPVRKPQLVQDQRTPQPALKPFQADLSRQAGVEGVKNVLAGQAAELLGAQE